MLKVLPHSHQIASRALRPAVRTTCSATPFTRPSHQQHCLSTTSQPQYHLFRSIRSKPTRSQRPVLSLSKTPHRTNSTTASSATPSQPSSSTTSAGPESLTWNRFLALRKTRRRISLTASIISAFACLTGGAVVLQSQDIEQFGAQMFGLDPLVVLGLTTFACGGVGWLVGPFFGSALFNVAYRGLRRQIVAKETEFFHRIKKHRVDPTSSSLGNPVPDYYGEKIGSVTDYRRWLKDQRAFNLKRDRLL